MVGSVFLEDIRTRIDDLIRRARLEEQVLSGEQLNWSPGHGLWTIGQIFDHLNVSVKLYIPFMERALETAKYGSPNEEVRHTFIGGAIAKAAGPGGNAPVPSKMRPAGGPFDQAVIEEFIRLHERVIELSRQAAEVDLRRTRVPNPMMPIMKMNLADCFAIVASHGERHIGQIVDLARHTDFPKS